MITVYNCLKLFFPAACDYRDFFGMISNSLFTVVPIEIRQI